MRSTAHLVIAVHNNVLGTPRFSKKKYLLVVDTDSQVKLKRFLLEFMFASYFYLNIHKSTNVLEISVSNVDTDEKDTSSAVFTLTGILIFVSINFK